MRTTIWFMKGFSNLYHAINDLKQGDKSNQFTILCSHTNPLFIGFEAADITEVEPKCYGQEFLAFCANIIKKYNVKVIFASQKQTLLGKNKAFFTNLGVELVTQAPPNMLDSIDNKGNLYQYLKNCPDLAVNIPEFTVFKNKEQFIEQYQLLRRKKFPLCIKPARGVYGDGFFTLSNTNPNLKSILKNKTITEKEYCDIIQQPKQSILLMQFLEGYERSVDCVAVNGNLIGGVIRKKIGENLPQLIEDNPLLLEQVRWLVKKLSLNGMFNVQFKDSKGKHYLLEINTRLSGRSFYATLVGFNMPYIAALLFSGMKKEGDIELKIQTGKKIGNISLGVILNNDIANINEIDDKESS